MYMAYIFFLGATFDSTNTGRPVNQLLAQIQRATNNLLKFNMASLTD